MECKGQISLQGQYTLTYQPTTVIGTTIELVQHTFAVSVYGLPFPNASTTRNTFYVEMRSAGAILKSPDYFTTLPPCVFQR